MQYGCISVAVALQRYVDVPPVAERQRDLALALAKQSGARVRIVSVAAPIALAPSALSLEDKLSSFAEPFRQAGLDVAWEIRKGAPTPRILDAVVATGADLLVLGSHSKQSPIDIEMGSAARTLLKEAPCAVLLVRPTAQEQEKARAMMIPHYPWVFVYV